MNRRLLKMGVELGDSIESLAIGMEKGSVRDVIT